MFQPLSDSLQASIRFFLHPLPSREFRPCYLRPTKSNRPLSDSVGLTLLSRLVFQLSLGAIFSAVESFVHTTYGKDSHKSCPLTFWLEPFSLIWLLLKLRSLGDSSFAFTIKNYPLAPNRRRLAVAVTFVVCTLSLSLLT